MSLYIHALQYQADSLSGYSWLDFHTVMVHIVNCCANTFITLKNKQTTASRIITNAVQRKYYDYYIKVCVV